MATGKYMQQSMLFDTAVEVKGCHKQPNHVYFCAKFLTDIPFRGDSEGLISFDLNSLREDDGGGALDGKGEFAGEGYVPC